MGKVFLTGDFNGHISNFSGNLDFDRYLENNDLFMNVSKIPQRTNKDDTLDSHGRKLLDLCKRTSFVVANGRLGNDYNIGEVIYCSMKGVNTVDYILVPITEIL